MTYGVTPTGFVKKTLTVIKEELETALRAVFGQSINLTPKSAFGQFVGIMAEREALLWEIAEALYRARDPDGATDAALEAVCALTGTMRRAAFKSMVVLTCTGSPGTTLNVERMVSVVDIGTKFLTTTTETLASVFAWVASTVYAVGARVTNGSKVYHCTVAGTSAASGGPSTTDIDIIDGSVHWTHLGSGTAVADVVASSQTAGPWVASARTLNVIETPVGGWSSALNLLDAQLGANIESDPELRLRREEELAAPGNASLEAVREHVLKVGKDTSNPVLTARVFENYTMSTNADGMPPKSIEVLVEGGEDEDILQAVFESKAAGVEPHGTVSGNVIDSEGETHVIKFSRPTMKDVYVKLLVQKNPDEFPSDGEAQLKSAVVLFGNKQKVGKDAVASSLGAQCFTVSGVLDVTATFIGLAPSPATSTTITCTTRERARYDTSRVEVVLSNGSP